MALLIVIASILAILITNTLYYHLRFKLPPGPRPWPIVGNLYHIKPLQFRCFYEWAQTYGPIISVWMGSKLNVVVTNMELAKEVLKENDQQLADRYRSLAVAKFSKDGKDLIWADYGPHYVKVRKVCTLELFTPRRLESLRPVREEEVTAMVESIFRDCTHPQNRGKSIEVKKYMGTVTFNDITRLVFGKKFTSDEGIVDEQGKELKAIVANGIKLGGSIAMAEHIPSWLRWMFPLKEEAFSKHVARRDSLARAIMEERTLACQENEHLVDALLSSRENYDLSDDTIIGILWNMINAGIDTVAVSAEWTMAEMIKNPRVQQKAQEELDRVIGSERVMTEADISSLPYIQAIAKEGLRLHPPTRLMLPHCANVNVKIGGYDIPKGSVVNVNVWAIGRDPAVWKDPLEFRPERFFEEDVDVKGHDFRVLPFGAGRRVCPGAQLAINLVTSMLGHLLHHFTLGPPEGMMPDQIDMSENPGLVTFMKTPLRTALTPRLPPHLYKSTQVS